MAHLTIRVPGTHVAAVRRALVGAHQRCGDELAQAAERYRVTHRAGDLDRIEGAAVELRDLRQAIEQLSRRARTTELTAHPEVIHDALAACGLEHLAP